MGKTTVLALPQAVRWSLWLVAGTVFGVLAGFAFGLTKPRVPGPQEDHLEKSTDHPSAPGGHP